MTKKDKKSKKAKKNEHLAISAEATTKHAHDQPKPSSKSSTKSDAKVDALVHEIIERIADKWTMVVLDVLAEHGTVRFTQLGKLAGGVSQKMLTKTVRQMEADGLATRTVHPIIPPHVDYALTPLGGSLGEAFCGVWKWAEKNHTKVEAARRAFGRKNSG